MDKVLFERGIRSYVLDGDNIRHGLNGDLGFCPNDRKENIRRISPYRKDRIGYLEKRQYM